MASKRKRKKKEKNDLRRKFERAVLTKKKKRVKLKTWNDSLTTEKRFPRLKTWKGDLGWQESTGHAKNEIFTTTKVLLVRGKVEIEICSEKTKDISYKAHSG